MPILPGRLLIPLIAAAWMLQAAFGVPAQAETATLATQHSMEASGVLRVAVSGVKSTRGHVRVDVCPPKDFLKDCPYGGAAPAVRGVTVVLVTGLPPGDYAVQVYQDENDNHSVDRNFLGFPREPIGFSNNAPIRFAPPAFRDAALAFSGGDESISLRLRHFL